MKSGTRLRLRLRTRGKRGVSSIDHCLELLRGPAGRRQLVCGHSADTGHLAETATQASGPSNSTPRRGRNAQSGTAGKIKKPAVPVAQLKSRW